MRLSSASLAAKLSAAPSSSAKFSIAAFSLVKAAEAFAWAASTAASASERLCDAYEREEIEIECTILVDRKEERERKSK